MIKSKNYICFRKSLAVPCGAILLTTKAICSKHMGRLVSISADYVLGERNFFHQITHKCRVLFHVVEHNMLDICVLASLEQFKCHSWVQITLINSSIFKVTRSGNTLYFQYYFCGFVSHFNYSHLCNLDSMVYKSC